MQDGSLFGEVDLFTPEHGVNPGSQVGFLGQLQEQLEGFVGDAILRVIQVQAHSLGGHPLAAAWIVPKEFPEMQLSNLLIVGFQGLPGRPFSEWCCCHVRLPFI